MEGDKEDLSAVKAKVLAELVHQQINDVTVSLFHKELKALKESNLLEER